MKSITKLAAIIAILTAGSCWAVTIQPGTYKLHWVIPAQRYPDWTELRGMEIPVHKMPDAEKARYSGLSSSNCLEGSGKQFRIILDVSKGTGRGYNTAYLFPLSSKKSARGLSGATKILLRPSRHNLPPECIDYPVHSDYARPASVELPFGARGAQITQKVQLDVDVNSDESGIPQSCWLDLRGNWVGDIKTDTGGVEFHVIDANASGVFGDEVSNNGDSMPDMLIVGKLPTKLHPKPDDVAKLMPLRSTIYFGGKLYSVKVSSTGDTINMEPYTGSVGTVRLQSVDSLGKPVQCDVWRIYGPTGAFTVCGVKEVQLPAGVYNGLDCLVSVPKRDSKAHKFQFGQTICRSISVANGRTTIAKIGGPIKVGIDCLQDGGTVDQIKRGAALDIEITPQINGDRISVEDRFCSVEILNCNGAAVYRGKVDNTYCSFKIPKSWKPGNYRIKLSIDSQPYQRTITATKNLKIQ